MTKSSLPMSSQVMKPGSIILSPSERLAIRSGPLKTQQTPNNCQTFFEYKGFVCNLLLWWRSRNKSASEKGQKHHRKVLQRRSTEEISYGVFEERKSNCFASPHVFPRPCPMWFLFVSEIESIPCWAEIPVPTGTWICHSSVPYYCA